MIRIGLISDTHGLLRPEALDYLRGTHHIIHAGDICGAHVLNALSTIAPLTAVRGNNDLGEWAGPLREVEQVMLGKVLIHVLHDVSQLDTSGLAGASVVVTGHSHKPSIARKGKVLYVNPGSAGPRRFALPISVGELLIDGARVTARTAVLNPPSTRFV